LSLADDSLPQDAFSPDLDDEGVGAIEFIDDDPDTTPDADEEMSGGLESEDDDDDETEDDALADDADEDDDEDDADDEEDAEKAELLRQKSELEQRLRQIDYERQQAANQAHWAGIQEQADAAFEWEWDEIQREKHNRIDPDAYERQEVAQWKSRVNDWYRRFNASINEARRAEMERAAVPAYAARLAQHFSLTDEQAQELLDYAPVDMPREAERRARVNAREAKLRKSAQQARRKAAREGKIAQGGNATGGGRSPATRVKRGSDQHLAALLAGMR
jgi:hypothetical protein